MKNFQNFLSRASQGHSRVQRAKEIKPLTEYLLNNPTFKKVALKIHDTKIAGLDKMFEMIHNAAFESDQNEVKKQLDEAKSKKPTPTPPPTQKK